MQTVDQKQGDALDRPHQMARLDGALMVVRTLVHAQLRENPATQRQADMTARYCQLLATRMKMPPMETHRLTLAAWLSALDPASGTAGRFIADFDLAPVLNAPPDTDNPGAGILRVVRTYARLQARDPELGRDPLRCRKAIEEQCPGPAPQPLVRRLMNILKDESSLDGVRVQAENILIVDPEEAISPLLAPPLRNQGFEVVVCGDVPSARHKLTEFRPSVVIAAKDMPIVDGLVFCQELKSSPATASIVFIALCPKGGNAAERQCLRAGCDEIVSRPVDLELLTLKIQHLLRTRPTAAAPAAPAADGRSAGFSGDLAEISFTDLIQIVCAGGRSLAIELRRGTTTGTVYVQEGAVIHACVGEQSGDAAFYAIMGWHEGAFTSRPCAHFPPRTIANSLMGLLMEGARLQDEQA